MLAAIACNQAPSLPNAVTFDRVPLTSVAGVERAACVEADEELEQGIFTSCLNGSCFQDVCDARWLERREALDLLAADILSKR